MWISGGSFGCCTDPVYFLSVLLGMYQGVVALDSLISRVVRFAGRSVDGGGGGFGGLVCFSGGDGFGGRGGRGGGSPAS